MSIVVAKGSTKSNEKKIAALSGYEKSTQVKKSQSLHRREDKQKIKQLECELNSKEKALTETAVLLVLSKKWEAIWGGAAAVIMQLPRLSLKLTFFGRSYPSTLA